MTATLAAAALAWPAVMAQAQMLSRAPVDFESCADLAEQAASREARASALTECNAKFAGRRKPGGGYTYYDFMQNRSFDIGGPNPTPQEQQYIDQQYTAFLDASQPDRAAAASALDQAVVPLPRQVLAPPTPPALLPRQPTLGHDKVPLPPRRPAVAAIDAKSHGKAAECAEPSFACDFPLLAAPINGLRRLFGASEVADQSSSPMKNPAKKKEAKDEAKNQANKPSKNQANNLVDNARKDRPSAIDAGSPM